MTCSPVAPPANGVRAEATRLREVQLYANEELIAAELALGWHARVIAELESLVAHYRCANGCGSC